MAYEYFDGGNAAIDTSGTLSGRLKGDYEKDHIHFFNITMSWKF